MVAMNTNGLLWQNSRIRTLSFLLLSTFLGSTTNGYGSSLISGLLACPRWAQDLPDIQNPTTLGLVIAAYPFGGILAFVPAPIVADRLGRRWAILLGDVGIMAAVLGQFFTATAMQFLGTRIVIGFFSVFINVGSMALLLELAHPRQRAVVGALYSTFFFVGSIAAAWVCFGSLKLNHSWPWRLPVILPLVLVAAQITMLCFTSESPRWLISKGRVDQAKRILAKYHACADENDELVVLEFSEIHASLAVQGDHEFGWFALLATAGNRKRFIICVFLGVATQSAGNGIISYYFAPVLHTVGISSATQQQLINGGLQIYNWMLSIAGALVADKVGRRKLLLLSSSTMLMFMVLIIACFALYANTGSTASGISVIVFHFLFLGGYVIGFTPIPNLYITEIWSTELRAKGASVFFLFQALSTCFNQYVNPVGLENLQWRYYFVFLGVLSGVVVFILFYVPETKGQSLEEVGDMFDRG